jgi:hypothetical protein
MFCGFSFYFQIVCPDLESKGYETNWVLNQTHLFFVMVIFVQGNPTFQHRVAKYEGMVVIALSILKC